MQAQVDWVRWTECEKGKSKYCWNHALFTTFSLIKIFPLEFKGEDNWRVCPSPGLNGLPTPTTPHSDIFPYGLNKFFDWICGIFYPFIYHSSNTLQIAFRKRMWCAENNFRFWIYIALLALKTLPNPSPANPKLMCVLSI